MFFGLFGGNKRSEPQVGGLYGAGLQECFVSLRRGVEHLSELERGGVLGSEFVVTAVANEVNFLCAHQIAESRMFSKPVNDFVSEYPVAYLFEACRYALETTPHSEVVANLDPSDRAELDLLIFGTCCAVLYGDDQDRALGIAMRVAQEAGKGIEEIDKGFSHGRRDAEEMISKFRSGEDTSGTKHLAIYIFENEIE